MWTDERDDERSAGAAMTMRRDSRGQHVPRRCTVRAGNIEEVLRFAEPGVAG